MSEPILKPCTGVSVFRAPENGAACIVIHYTADKLKRDPCWAAEESRIYAGGQSSVEWLQEYEIDFEAELRLRTYWGFDPSRNIVPAYSVPHDWEWWLAFDFGQTAPTAVLFLAQNPMTKEMVVFDEIYVTKTPVNDVCRMIYDKLSFHRGVGITSVSLDDVISDAVGDPSGTSYAIEYGQDPWPISIRTKGFKTQWRLNDRRVGEAKVNEALVPSFVCCNKRWFPAGQANAGYCGKCKEKRGAKALLTIMAERAPNLIRTLPSILRAAPATDEAEPVERDDTGQEDHAPDALRYGVMPKVWELPEYQEEPDLLSKHPATLKPEEMLERHIQMVAKQQDLDEMTEGDYEGVIYADPDILDLFEAEQDLSLDAYESVLL